MFKESQKNIINTQKHNEYLQFYWTEKSPRMCQSSIHQFCDKTVTQLSPQVGVYPSVNWNLPQIIPLNYKIILSD